MKHRESNIQIQCVSAYYRYGGKPMTLFAIPNGGARNTITGAILKREGVVAGVADLFLMRGTNKYHGLFIEMKTDKGKQSDSQVSFQRAAEEQNYKYVVCRSVEQFITEIQSYLEDN